MPVALSIRQPWVELILQGRKTIEVRTWATRHRGELWLHASAHRDSHLLKEFGMSADNLSFGALIGTCELYNCIQFTNETWKELRIYHLKAGPLEKPQYAWFLRDPIRTQPTTMKGRL